jgi:hypothetical protein
MDAERPVSQADAPIHPIAHLEHGRTYHSAETLIKD